MDEFLNPDLKPFSELSPEEMHCIVQAKLNGNCECRNDAGNFVEPVLFAMALRAIYRTKPKPVKKLVIPWVLIKDEFICASINRDEELHFFKDTPYIFDDMWDIDEGYGVGYPLKDIDTTGVDWETSLTYRPGFEPKGE